MLLPQGFFYIKTKRQNHTQRVDAISTKIGSVYLKFEKKYNKQSCAHCR